MGGLLGGGTTKIEAERIGSMRVQTSAYGMALPLVYGRTRLAGNLIWYGDFKAIKHKEKSGGKGGGGGVEQTTYTYEAAVMMGLCEGPINSVKAVWKGKEKQGDGYASVFNEAHVVPSSAPYTVTIPDWAHDGASFFGGFAMVRLFSGAQVSGQQYTVRSGVYTFGPEMAGQTVYLTYTRLVPSYIELGMSAFLGGPAQAPWPYLSTKHPGEALSYPGVAYVSASGYALDSSASLENHSFEIVGMLPHDVSKGIYDANPRDVLVDFLTDPTHGAGFPADKLDSLSLFSDYCVAAGILISPAWAEQRPAHEYVSEIAQIGNSAVLWSENKLKLIPYADKEIKGSVTYAPNVTPLYDLTDDDFLTGDGDHVKLRRKKPADAFNRVEVRYNNRANEYNADIAKAEDQADIELYGLRPMAPVDLESIADPSVAEIVATTIKDRVLYIRNDYEFRLGWRYALLEPMDILTLNHAALGLNKTPVRIVEIGEDDEGDLTVIAEEFPSGVSAPALYPASVPAGYSADYNLPPGDVSEPVFFEPPIEKTTTGLEVWAAVSGAGEFWGGCDVWASLDGSTYKIVGTVQGGARYGSLRAPLGSGGAATASVQLAGQGGQMLPGTSQEAEALATLCWVGDSTGGEFFAYQGAALVAANEYDLTTLVRAAYGTADAGHAAGQQFVRVDERIVKSEPLDLAMIGKPIWFKFQSFNVWGGGKQDLDSVAAYAYIITGVMAKLPPSDVTGFAAATTADRTQLSWGAVPDVDLAEYEVREGTVWEGAPTAAKGRYTLAKLMPKPAGTYNWMVKAIDRLGNKSTIAASASLTVSSPAAVSVTGVLSGKDYMLSWSEPAADYSIDRYEIRQGDSWSEGAFVTSVSALSLKAAVTWSGDRTFWVAAIDLAGNVGTPASASISAAPPVAPTISSAFSGAQVVLSWDEPAASLPIAEYEVRQGPDWEGGAYIPRLTARSLALTVNWGGARTFWIAAVDINGTVGAAGSCAVSISAPSQPTITAEVIDNNVLLRWSEATGTLPVDHCEVRRGATWAAAAVVGTLQGRFSAYFESSAGTYTYWVAAVDSAGNAGTPAGVTAIVSQPPDFRLLYDQNSDFPGTKSNCVLEAGVLYGPINTTETWQQHFVNNSWTSPQDQVTAGYDYFIEPTPNTGSYEETIDYGVMVASTMITVTANQTAMDGNPSITPKISVSADNINWTDYPGVWQAFATNFRYVKVRLDFSASGGDDLAKVSQLNIKMAFKLKGDAGSGTANSGDSGGTQVNFNETFVDVEAITVTANATASVTAVYDFTDTPNPTGFKVLLFDASGNRVSGGFSWSAKGV